MYERDTAMLEQYDLTVKNIKKVRSGWLCIAQEGLFLWKEGSAKEERLSLENWICEKSCEMGLSHMWNQAGGSGELRLDHFVRNKEGQLLTTDGFGRKFVLKTWTEGHECEVKNVEDFYTGARAAACMHQMFRMIKPELEKQQTKQSVQDSNGEVEVPVVKLLAVQESYEDLWNRRRREISRVQSYVRKRNNKNSFEQILMKETPYYAKQAQKALELLPEMSSSGKLQICHGDFHYHNLIYGKQKTWICQTNRFHVGEQISDFYVFLRKCMEKQGWNWILAEHLLELYRSHCPVSGEEMQLLYCLFLFPEKYWKQLNFYLQSNKAWMPDKNVTKLKNLMNQETKRQEFLEKLRKYAYPEAEKE
jgi:spore coat protein I